MKATLRHFLCALSLVTVSGAATATPMLLESRLDGDALYDPNSGLTWLADANYAKTSAYDSNGKMTWQAANEWANGLTFGGFDDWRLPDAAPDCERNFNCTDSEMGSLYYTALGGTANNPTDPSNAGFSQVFADYWLATEFSRDDAKAWVFRMELGRQGRDLKTKDRYAWAVRG